MNNGPKNCDGRVDGYYQDGESGCRSYFYCAGGMKAVYVCPGKSLFDGQRCVEPDVYTCPYSSPDCQLGGGGATVSNGYQADLNSGCRNYYFCSGDGHKLITLTCSDGRLFDGKKCVDPDQYRCPSSDLMTTTERPKVTAGSVHLDSYYSYPSAGSARKPSGSASHPQTYFVSSRNSAMTTTGRPQSASSSAKDYCEKNYGFFVVQGTGCRNYYICIGGSRSDLQCSGDTVFNGQVCVDPAQYTCPESSHKSDCQGKSDGVYPDRKSGCRNYYLCLGQVQTDLSCPAGQLFDGRRCADSRRVTCIDPVATEGRTHSVQSPCAGRTNGLYLDHNYPGCRGYLYCRSGRPYGPAGRCTRSERFSGQHSRCLPKHEVECRLPTDDNEDDEEDYMMAEASAMLVTVIADDFVTTTTTTAAAAPTSN